MLGADRDIAEYNALQAEMSQRASGQQALMALNLAAVGTIVGFVVSENAAPQLLLVVAVASPTLGFLWLDHHRNIRRIATYLREVQVPASAWEVYIAQHPPARAWTWMFRAAIFLIFLGVAVAALVLGWPTSEDPTGLRVLCGVGLVMTLLFGAAFFAVLRGFLEDSSGPAPGG